MFRIKKILQNRLHEQQKIDYFNYSSVIFHNQHNTWVQYAVGYRKFYAAHKAHKS